MCLHNYWYLHWTKCLFIIYESHIERAVVLRRFLNYLIDGMDVIYCWYPSWSQPVLWVDSSVALILLEFTLVNILYNTECKLIGIKFFIVCIFLWISTTSAFFKLSCILQVLRHCKLKVSSLSSTWSKWLSFHFSCHIFSGHVLQTSMLVTHGTTSVTWLLWALYSSSYNTSAALNILPKLLMTLPCLSFRVDLFLYNTKFPSNFMLPYFLLLPQSFWCCYFKHHLFSSCASYKLWEFSQFYLISGVRHFHLSSFLC